VRPVRAEGKDEKSFACLYSRRVPALAWVIARKPLLRSRIVVICECASKATYAGDDAYLGV